MGMGIDLASGNYSQGISGFKIENGEIAYPVKEITLAGNMLEMFAKSTFANDLEMNTGCDSEAETIFPRCVRTVTKKTGATAVAARRRTYITEKLRLPIRCFEDASA
jgi:predicted Zn-dependent protease